MSVGYPDTFNQGILQEIYHRLMKSYGPQNWWPADSPFEVKVGAVLTQNTAWINVEKAIENLNQDDLLSLEAIVNLSDQKLAALLRPSGYFNIKTRRLKNLCQWLSTAGGIGQLEKI